MREDQDTKLELQIFVRDKMYLVSIAADQEGIRILKVPQI